MERGVALITGARARLGRALALSLAQAGYAIGVHHRKEAAEADAVVQTIREAGGRAAAVQTELTDEDQVRALVARTADALGPLTLLVNNASRFEDDRVGSLTRDSWDAHMEANLR